MRKMMLVLGLVLAGCDGGGGEACDTEGETRCMDEAAESCTGGEWTLTEDCAANGGTCMQDDSMMEGMAHCM